MQTTLELPERRMRRVKIRAVQSDRYLKDVIAELIVHGREESGRPAGPERLDLTKYIGKSAG